MKKLAAAVLTVIMLLTMSSCRNIELISEIIEAAGKLSSKETTGTDSPETEPSVIVTDSAAPETTAATKHAETTKAAETQKVPEKTTAQNNQPKPEALAEVTPLEVWVQKYSKQDWDGDKQLIDACHDLIILGDDDAKKYTKLASAFDSLNKTAKSDIDKTTAVSGAASTAVNKVTYYVTRADSRMVSILYHENNGGTFPGYSYKAHNIDTQTGKTLVLSDVFSDINGLPDIITAKMKEKYGNTAAGYNNLQNTLKNNKAEDYNWTMSYQSITIFFTASELDTRPESVIGDISVDIWFDEYHDAFNKAYTEAPNGGYARSLPFHLGIALDINTSDKKRDDILIDYIKDDDGFFKSVGVRLNADDAYSVEPLGHEVNPYLVFTGENYFIYYECLEESTGSVITVVHEFADGKPMECGFLHGRGFMRRYTEETGVFYSTERYVFTNPSDTVMVRNLDLFGSYSVYSDYAIDNEGYPESLTGVYHAVFSGTPVKAKVPVTVTLSADNKEHFMPAGTVFYFISTDYSSYIEMKLEDGRLCKIAIESVNPCMINGKSDYDTFEYELNVG